MWAALAAVAGLAVPAHAAPAPRAHPYRAPRTAAGQPDLQGVWTNVTVTRLERRANLPLVVPRSEEAAYEASAIDAFMHPPGDPFDQRASEWQPLYRALRFGGRMRTSIIVSPADGRLPYTPDGRARQATFAAAGAAGFDGPEARPPVERCLRTGPPMLNPNSAAAVQIVQTAGAVAILMEMNHDVRVVRLGGAHPPASVRLWLGDSVGHWEGDTLVVETTNFHPQAANRLTHVISPQARVTERFTRVSRTELAYAFEVDDPATYTQAWRGELPFHAETAPLYEFACHEGNYSMTGMLAGTRQAEAEAAKAPAGGR